MSLTGTRPALWLGGIRIPIPRHTEISVRTTEDIPHECEEKLGRGWWRK